MREAECYHALLPLLLCSVLLGGVPRVLHAQEIALYSEFERVDPYGQIVSQDREPMPREVLSPAVPRNGHFTAHVVVTAPAGTNYFLYVASSPENVVRVKIYRESFVPCGGSQYCPDWLTELKSPSFGAMPESREHPEQTTRSYLLDVYVPPGVLPRRVRVEALLKTAIWQVAPLEIRVIDAMVPEAHEMRDDIAPVESQSSETGRRQLLRLLHGLPPEMPLGLLHVRDAVQRNAAEDALLAEARGWNGPALLFAAWPPMGFLRPGAEWYLRVRDGIRSVSPPNSLQASSAR